MKKHLAIDLGQYSVKFYETIPEGRKSKLLSYEEVRVDNRFMEKLQNTIDHAPDQNSSTTPEQYSIELLRAQAEIIQNYLERERFEGKIITHLPQEFMTSRYLFLPVSNKKKAELMIPFQLEENLPFSISETHFTSMLHRQGKEIFAQICVTEKKIFREVYDILESKNSLPAVLSSQIFSFQSYFIDNELHETICLLDIGHRATRAYFVRNGMIVANHSSPIAGKVIDEVISQNYEIPIDEAILYKHDNAFFLNDGDMNQVDENQREFAELMKKTLWPLILDLKRWQVGLKVKYALPVSRVFITGGTTNIKNLDGFLKEHLNLPVEYFRPYKSLSYDFVGIDGNLKNSMAVADVMTVGETSRFPPPSFLHGEFSGHYSESIPLYSIAYNFARISIICLLIVLGLYVERLFIKQDIDGLDRIVVAQLQSADFDIPRRTRDLYRTRPQVIKNELTQIHRQEIRENRSLDQLAQTNAERSLLDFNQTIPKSDEIDLVRLYVSQRILEAEFKSSDPERLQSLQEKLFNMRRSDDQVYIDEANHILQYSYKIK